MKLSSLFIDCEISFSFPEMVSSNACTMLRYAVVVINMMRAARTAVAAASVSTASTDVALTRLGFDVIFYTRLNCNLTNVKPLSLERAIV